MVSLIRPYSKCTNTEQGYFPNHHDYLRRRSHSRTAATVSDDLRQPLLGHGTAPRCWCPQGNVDCHRVAGLSNPIRDPMDLASTHRYHCFLRTGISMVRSSLTFQTISNTLQVACAPWQD